MARKKKGTLTFKQCRDHTLRHHEPWRDGGGRKSAIMYSNHFLKMHGNDFDVYRITGRLILEDCTYLMEKKGFTKSSCNRYASAISMPLKFSQDFGDLDKNWEIPRFKRYSTKASANRREHFSKKEVASMVRFAESELGQVRLADIILFAALTGIRQEKIMKLRVNRIDFSEKLITVLLPKGGYDSRTIPINDELLPMLERRCSEKAPTDLLFGDDWLVADSKGEERVSVDTMYTQWRKCVFDHLGKPENGKWVFHSLRHSFGTWCIQDGINIRDVADLMGHSSTRVTERYLHASDQGRHKILNKVSFNLAA